MEWSRQQHRDRSISWIKSAWRCMSLSQEIISMIQEETTCTCISWWLSSFMKLLPVKMSWENKLQEFNPCCQHASLFGIFLTQIPKRSVGEASERYLSKAKGGSFWHPKENKWKDVNLFLNLSWIYSIIWGEGESIISKSLLKWINFLQRLVP